MFRLLLGGLERLEALDELPPERLERRVPIEAGESPHLEDGVAEVPEQRQRAAVARTGLDLHPLHEADDLRGDVHEGAHSRDDRYRHRRCRGHGHGHGQQDRRPEGRALRLFDGLNLAHSCPVYISYPPTPEIT